MTSPRLFNALNLFRLYGALLVVAAHYAPVFTGGTLFAFGTGIFFIAAGFYALGFERRRGLEYLLARLLRLYPGYLVAVALYAFVMQPEGLFGVLGHHALFLLSAATRETVFALNPPFWSLSVFFTFFVIAAFVPLPRPGGIGLALLTALPMGLLFSGATDWRNGYLELLAFPLHFYAFWLGGLLAARWQPSRPAFKGAWAVAAAAVAFSLAAGLLHGQWIRGGPEWLAFGYREAMAFAHALLLWALLRAPGLARRMPWLDRLGAAGFGVFLFHTLTSHLVSPHLQGVAGAALALVLAAGLAWLSLYLIERPLQHRLAPRLARCFAREK